MLRSPGAPAPLRCTQGPGLPRKHSGWQLPGEWFAQPEVRTKTGCSGPITVVLTRFWKSWAFSLRWEILAPPPPVHIRTHRLHHQPLIKATLGNAQGWRCGAGDTVGGNFRMGTSCQEGLWGPRGVQGPSGTCNDLPQGE